MQGSRRTPVTGPATAAAGPDRPGRSREAPDRGPSRAPSHPGAPAPPGTRGGAAAAHGRHADHPPGRRAARRRPDHGRRQLLNLKHLAGRHDRPGTARVQYAGSGHCEDKAAGQRHPCAGCRDALHAATRERRSTGVLRQRQWCYIQHIPGHDRVGAVIVPPAHAFNLK